MNSKEELNRLFEEFDQDCSGEISMMELKHVARRMGLDTDKYNMDELLRSIDVDVNNSISRDEFVDFFGSIERVKGFSVEMGRKKKFLSTKRKVFYVYLGILFIVAFVLCLVYIGMDSEDRGSQQTVSSRIKSAVYGLMIFCCTMFLYSMFLVVVYPTIMTKYQKNKNRHKDNSQTETETNPPLFGDLEDPIETRQNARLVTNLHPSPLITLGGVGIDTSTYMVYNTKENPRVKGGIHTDFKAIENQGVEFSYREQKRNIIDTKHVSWNPRTMGSPRSENVSNGLSNDFGYLGPHNPGTKLNTFRG